MATTIHNLEVRFDVEGEGDDAVFTRLFEKHIRVWDKMKTEMKARQRFMEAERSLGDRRKEVAD
jgi:uncharacterized protein YdcH (DUF465 family)